MLVRLVHDLVNLVVPNRIKGTLSEEAPKYITLREDRKWLKLHEIERLV